MVQALEQRMHFSAGMFDTTFAANGTVDAGHDRYSAVASLSGGKTLALFTMLVPSGAVGTADLVRFNRNGTVDTHFGNHGFSPVANLTSVENVVMVVLRDGKILLSGDVGDDTDTVSNVYRLLPNGKLDKTFGTDGLAAISTSPQISQIEGMAVDARGGLLLAGSVTKVDSHNLTSEDQEFSLVRLNRNGTRDTHFGTDGQTMTDFGGDVTSESPSGAVATSLLLQKDGKIVIAGREWPQSKLAVARYTADGNVDPTFASTGLETLGTANWEGSSPIILAQQSDGKLLIPLIGGVARLTVSGALDTSFGNAGTAALPITQPGLSGLQSVVLQTDGKIVGFGDGFITGSNNSLVARFNADGTADSTFAAGGIAVSNSSFDQSGVALGGYTGPKGSIVALTDVGVMRFTSSGKLDPTFGHQGTTWNPNGITGQIDASALQKDGKIIVAGSELAVDPTLPAEAAVVRYNADGSLDRTFGDDGRMFITVGDDANFDSLVIQRDGKIVAGGYGDVDSAHQFLVVRLTRSGRIDRSFNRTGILTSAFTGAASQSVSALATGPGNTLVAAGSADQQMAVERILPNGKLDPSFASGGQLAVQPLQQSSNGAGLVVGIDGSITIGGTIGNDFGMIRLLPDGTYDAAFGTNGIVTTPFLDAQGASTSSEANALIADANGNLILGGSTGGFSDDPLLPLGGLALARYHADGSLDTTFGTGGTLTDYAAGEGFYVASLGIEHDGKIIAGGLAYTEVAVARLTNTGLDTTFGFLGINPNNPSLPINGISHLGEAGSPGKPDDAPVTGVQIQADGKIIAAHGTSVSRLTD
jgi:uncharacterized delta-60 repeat protein